MLDRLFRTLTLGYKSLLLHKLRSALAVLGILIGVMAVIWLVALGEGVSYQAQQQIKELGATNIIVKSVKPAAAGTGGSGAGSMVVAYGLTRDDFTRMLMVPHVVRAVPLREITTEARYSGRSSDVKLLGCTPDYDEINHLDLSRGRFLTDRDSERRDNVCVIGSETARLLFPFEEPLGKTIEVYANLNPQVFTIVGVTQHRMPSASIGGSLEGRDYNLDVYIPIETFQDRVGDQVFTSRTGSREAELVELSQVTVTVHAIEQVEEAADIIGILLEKYHTAADYSITVPKELLRQAEMLRMMFNVLLVLIAGISLVVGGIGIMNIMLATVTERTREIGVRRAMGATRRDIIQQFLAETTVLSAAGGFLGVGLGFLCYPAVSLVKGAVEHRLPDVWTTLPPTIQQLEPRVAAWSIFVSFGISVVVGVVFGLYPARRAALMDPIEALRHE
ncbi:MAG TPA: ABC transporter permease [Planctomycetaceae bacterium]|nr:ABC transporter permease [Planctomycetaceae bacterium]